MKKFILFLFLYFLIFVGCMKTDSSEKLSIPFTDNEIQRSWEIVSAQGAPDKPLDTYSIWTFNNDGTYEWYFKYPEYYNLQGKGTYIISNNKLQLTGIMVDEGFVNATLPIYFAKDKKSFSFNDIDGAEFVYQIANTENELSRAVSFQKYESYNGDCINKPAGHTCIPYDDGYIWLIPYIINDVANCSGSSNSVTNYYIHGNKVSIRCFKTNSVNIIQCHRILNTDSVKIVQE